MAGRPTLPLDLTPKDRTTLNKQAACGSGRTAERARILLCRADGLSQKETAQKLKCSEVRVSRWTTRFRELGIEGIKGKPRKHRSQDAGEIAGRSRPQPIRTPPPNHSPSMRKVAEAAGVSVMTVSRVMRNVPDVHPEYRRRVLNAAEKVGYRPDPELRKLMIHLRKRKVIRPQGSICSLEASTWHPVDQGYFKRLVASARRRANTLGFLWESFPLEEFIARPRHVSRILYHRGVEGIFLPPVSQETLNRDLPKDARWDRFSLIAATYSITAPVLRRVVPDHFRNMTLICSTLTDYGYRRIGLAISEHLDKRVHYHFSGSFSAFHRARRLEMVPPCYHNATSDIDQLRGWFAREQPEALIVSNSHAVQSVSGALGLRIPGPVAVVAAALIDEMPSSAGIDESPERVGAIAVDLLGGMIVHREKGLSPDPTVTMVKGVWQDGDSASQSAKSRRPRMAQS